MSNSIIKQEFRPQFFSWVIFLLPALAITTRPGVGIIEILILLATIYYAVPLWKQRKEFFGSTKFIVLAFSFNLAAATASLLSDKFVVSGIDNPLRQLLATAAIGIIIFTRPKAEWFWHGLMIGTIGAACIAMYQRFGLHMVRAEGAYMAIMFGDIAMAMGLMALASVRHYSKTKWAALPYIAFLSGVLASLLSGTRGGWPAILFCLIPLYFYRPAALDRKSLLAALMGAALLTGAFFIPKVGVSERVAAVSTEIDQYMRGNANSSIGSRLEMWKGAWNLFVENPITGVGRKNFHQGLNALIARGEIDPSVGIYRHAHNEMLHALATQGMIGGSALLLLYVAPLLFFLRGIRRNDQGQPYAIAGLLVVLSFIYFGQTQVLFSHHIGSAFYALAVSVLAGVCASIQREYGIPPSSK
jgi:O-antigen ligase